MNEVAHLAELIIQKQRHGPPGTVMLESTINKSINHSLSRTLITSLTTLFVIIVLLVYGGEVIRPFSFTMLVGVIVGTYSSIYIASALLATIYQSSNK